jgi:hypothetical protein
MQLGGLCLSAAGNSREPTGNLHFIFCLIVHETGSMKCLLFIHL